MTVPDRPAAVAVLASQLDTTMEFFWARLEGLSNEEYRWEAVPGAWNVVPRERQRTSLGFGSGEWVVEWEPRDPKPAPMRTIAWLMWHLIEMCSGRADWSIGEHRIGANDVPVAATADEAVALLRAAVAQWRSVFDALDPAEYDVVGRSQYPGGLDPELPLREILWWQNREIIHHTAEISLLRDLHLWQSASQGGNSGRMTGD